MKALVVYETATGIVKKVAWDREDPGTAELPAGCDWVVIGEFATRKDVRNRYLNTAVVVPHTVMDKGTTDLVKKCRYLTIEAPESCTVGEPVSVTVKAWNADGSPCTESGTYIRRVWYGPTLWIETLARAIENGEDTWGGTVPARPELFDATHPGGICVEAVPNFDKAYGARWHMDVEDPT